MLYTTAVADWTIVWNTFWKCILESIKQIILTHLKLHRYNICDHWNRLAKHRRAAEVVCISEIHSSSSSKLFLTCCFLEYISVLCRKARGNFCIWDQEATTWPEPQVGLHGKLNKELFLLYSLREDTSPDRRPKQPRKPVLSPTRVPRYRESSGWRKKVAPPGFLIIFTIAKIFLWCTIILSKNIYLLSRY